MSLSWNWASVSPSSGSPEAALRHHVRHQRGEQLHAAPTFRDGVPVTTKADAGSHGFGTRSMRGIVERHGGVLTFGCEDGIFHVDALLPMA